MLVDFNFFLLFSGTLDGTTRTNLETACFDISIRSHEMLHARFTNSRGEKMIPREYVERDK